MKDFLTVGRVAKQAGVNLQTVRYYGRRRLLAPAKRTESGYRLYELEAVRIIRFIKNAQGLGFTLDEIARLLGLRVNHKNQCALVRHQAKSRLEIVRDKIVGLKAMERVLNRLIRICSAKGTTDFCPILESLNCEINGGKINGGNYDKP